MTAELFPEADRVNILLDEESVSPPDGKVWKVSIVCGALGSEVKIFSDEENIGATNEAAISSQDPDFDSTVTTFMHSEGAIQTVSGKATIIGWEFEYSE